MRTPKKVWKDIAGKLKNRKGTSAAKGADIEAMQEDVEEVKVEVKEQTNADKATETDIQLCEDINKDSEDLQPICESSKEAKNASVETATDEKSSTKTTQQKQAILAGSAGIVLLISSIPLYIMKMHIIAVVGGIVGLACISFALYNVLKPNTKLEKVECVEVCRRDAKDVCIEQASAKATQ